MDVLILSIATFFNLIILHIKFKKERYQDMAIDVAVFISLGAILGGSVTGFSVATVTSALVSAYLLTQPLGANRANT